MQIRVIQLNFLQHCAVLCSNCCSILKIVDEKGFIEGQIKNWPGLPNFMAHNLQKWFYMYMLQYATVCCNYCCIMLKLFSKATLSDTESKVVWVCQVWAIRSRWKKSYHEKDSIFDNFATISKRRKRQYSDVCLVFSISQHLTSSEINFRTSYHFYTSLGHTK